MSTPMQVLSKDHQKLLNQNFSSSWSDAALKVGTFFNHKIADNASTFLDQDVSDEDELSRSSVKRSGSAFFHKNSQHIISDNLRNEISEAKPYGRQV